MIRSFDQMNVNDTSILMLPHEVIGEGIGPHLPAQDCARMATVCELWGSIFTKVCDERLWDRVVFDEKKWLQIPGVKSVSTYEVELAKKAELIKRLKSPCDIFNEKDPIQPHRFENPTNKLICETRMLILFPHKINESYVNVNRIGQIFSYMKEIDNKGTAFDFMFGDDAHSTYRQMPAKRTYLAEVSLDVIPKSRDTQYSKKIDLLNCKGYRIPSPFEAVTSILIMNIGKNSDYYFGDRNRDFTRTSTDGSHMKMGLAVGMSFDGHGMNVNGDCQPNKDYGAMAVKEVL